MYVFLLTRVAGFVFFIQLLTFHVHFDLEPRNREVTVLKSNWQGIRQRFPKLSFHDPPRHGQKCDLLLSGANLKAKQLKYEV